MFSSRAQAISINFLVKFILALVMFGLGVSLLWNIYFQGTDLAGTVDGELQSRIVELNCKPTQVVCVSSARLKIEGGEYEIIDFEIHNNHGVELNYDVELILEDPDVPGSNLLGDGSMNILMTDKKFALAGRSEKLLSIGVYTYKTTPLGWYTLRVQIDPIAPPPNDLPPIVRRVDIEIV